MISLSVDRFTPVARGRRNPIYAWLRARFSRIDHGIKLAGGVRHCNKNADVENCLRTKRFIPCLTNGMLNAHVTGSETYYFTGNGDKASDLTLVNIDVDCKLTGSRKGAIDFACYLNNTILPNLYEEASTNGRGGHGYFTLDKQGHTARQVNELLKRFAGYLNDIAEPFDVELVEIKGTCPRFEGGRYIAGQLAKIPRELWRADELMATATVTFDWMTRLVDEHEKSRRQPGSSAATDLGASHDATLPSKSRKQQGSISGKSLGQDEIDALQGRYLHAARTIIGDEPIVTSGKQVVTEYDVAVFLMLLMFFRDHPFADGAMPTLRFQRFWEKLYAENEVKRQWDAHRYTAIRNRLSALGLLVWIDNGYIAPIRDKAGNKIKGKAAKWDATPELVALTRREDNRTEPLVGTAEFVAPILVGFAGVFGDERLKQRGVTRVRREMPMRDTG
jgi:hypothetical protein